MASHTFQILVHQVVTVTVDAAPAHQVVRRIEDLSQDRPIESHEDGLLRFAEDLAGEITVGSVRGLLHQSLLESWGVTFSVQPLQTELVGD